MIVLGINGVGISLVWKLSGVVVWNAVAIDVTVISFDLYFAFALPVLAVRARAIDGIRCHHN